jgi:hypothetical protein
MLEKVFEKRVRFTFLASNLHGSSIFNLNYETGYRTADAL